MNQHRISLSCALLAGLVFTACQPNPALTGDPTRSAADVETELVEMITSTSEAFRQEPFVKREFEPYLEKQWIGQGISYGCYREGQAPGVNGPSEAEILEDLNILKPHWNLIRVYGSDDDSERILKVIHKHLLPIRVMLGVWLENETSRPERRPENIKQVARAIRLASTYPDEIIAINVANESQVDWSWHRMDMDNLIRYIRIVRAETREAVTTADDYNFWNKETSHRVADEIDFIALHAYPLWNGKTLEGAMAWIDSVVQAAQAFHPDHELILSETGWATRYQPRNNGPGQEGALVKTEVSIGAQEVFLKQFIPWSEERRITTFLFEAFDEPWKGGGSSTDPDVMEKHWGLFYENRTPKPSFSNFQAQRSAGDH